MRKEILIGSSIVLFVILAILGNYNIQDMHSGGFYRTEEIYENLGPVVYYEEGLYATITVRDLLDSKKALFINGKGQGGQGITDLRVNFLLSYLPLLIKPESKDALVIGLGTGTTSGQLSQYTNVTTVEIETKVLEASNYFGSLNLNVLENPNHSIIINDARNYLLKNDKKYDIISQEPSDPWQLFSTSLYSREFLELASEDLEQEGLYVYWVPVYTMSVNDFRNFYFTFSEVFPNNVAFANIKPTENTPVKFETSEIILIGSKKEINISKEIFAHNYAKLIVNSKRQLNLLELNSGENVYRLLIFTSEQMKNYADDADLITDDNLLLEFSTAKNVLNQNPMEVINDIEQFVSG